jgi:DNA repair protein RecO (recombination protein O)
MLHTTQGIVLHNIKYADQKIISKIYTREFGLISASINVGNTPKAKIKAGVIQPLAQIEFILSLKENRDVQQLSDIKCLFVYTGLLSNFNKLCIAQFLNEVLYKCLKEQSPNEDLFNLICDTYQWLDQSTEGYIDAHIYFLFELTKHLGFYPVNNRSAERCYFDTLEGKFSASTKSFPMGFDHWQSVLFSTLFSHSISNQKKITRTERVALLDCLLHYYKMQIPGLMELRSYKVLQEMLNELN